MEVLLLILLVVSLSDATTVRADEELLYRLPDDFIIGAGSSAYQSEGAWNVSGR